jgi:hypothetical protein
MHLPQSASARDAYVVDIYVPVMLRAPGFTIFISSQCPDAVCRKAYLIELQYFQPSQFINIGSVDFYNYATVQVSA